MMNDNTNQSSELDKMEEELRRERKKKEEMSLDNRSIFKIKEIKDNKK